jgi:hypothetical protein
MMDMVMMVTIIMAVIMMGAIMMDADTIGIEIQERLAVRDIPAPPAPYFRWGIRLLPRFRRASSTERMGLRRMNRLNACLLLGLICGAVTPCSANPTSLEPTREGCEAAVEQTRSLAAVLPADDLSRYFAERDLHQAMIEAGNGEFDDCLEMTARATEEIKERRHTLQPGEKLKVLQADE